MFYKVIFNSKVIDVLDELMYLKYQEKHDRMIFCGEAEAQAILSSNQDHIWHVEGFYDLAAKDYDTVILQPIDRYEYEQLKIFNCKTPEELIDNYTALLLAEELI